MIRVVEDTCKRCQAKLVCEDGNWQIEIREHVATIFYPNEEAAKAAWSEHCD